MLKIVKADIKNLEAVSELFDAYRVFYEQESDIEKGKEFLQSRLINKEGVIFMALEKEVPIGFTQLYKTFSSVTMQPFYILNDLFVKPSHRGQGVGQKLLESAQQFCLRSNYKGLALETANDNPAQKLYERLGWKKDVAFLHYFWKNPNS